jgi:hypothetical protein
MPPSVLRTSPCVLMATREVPEFRGKAIPDFARYA